MKVSGVFYLFQSENLFDLNIQLTGYGSKMNSNFYDRNRNCFDFNKQSFKSKHIPPDSHIYEKKTHDKSQIL